MRDICAISAIPCFGFGVAFGITAATFLTNLNAREAVVFAAMFWLGGDGGQQARTRPGACKADQF
jgi:hypothetical protein